MSELVQGGLMKAAKLLFALGLTSIAGAVTAAPPIAYSTVGKGGADEVWLVNPDGTGAIRLYQGTNKVVATSLTVSPLGGQVAFIETNNISFAIKVISYNSAGTVLAVTKVPQVGVCSNYGLDFRSDGLLIFSQQCNRGSSNSISAWDGSQVTTLIGNLQPAAPFIVRWLRDGSGFLWQATNAAGTAIELRESANGNPSSWITLWQIPTASGSMGYMDIAHQSNAFLASFDSVAQVQRYTFDPISGVNPQPTVVAAGQDGHYSPDDSEIIYRVYTRQGYNLVHMSPTGATKTIATGIHVSAWGGSN